MHALVDKFGRAHRYLRLSLTDRCNMACNYCMPSNKFADETARTPNHMTADEILRICGIFVNRCGIEKIRLTGGEPLVRSDFAQVAEAVSLLPVKQIGITTNGVLLNRHESTLIRNRVNLWNLSLDTLQSEKFELISNRPRSFWERTMKAVHRAIDLAKSGTVDSVKINTVMMRNVNDDEIIDFVNLTRDYTIQLRFIEFMPFSGNSFSSRLMIPKHDILNTITQSFGNLETAEQESGSSSTGSDIRRVPGYRGTLGVISSMTDSFCGSCDRVRLTADGKVRNCLFAASRTEVSLLDILRRGGSDDEIEAAIRGNVDAKNFSHGGKRDVEEIRKLASHSRPMIELGGMCMHFAQLLKMVRDHSLVRLAKLEEENIALQSEILSLKRQLLNQHRSGGSRPSSPEIPFRKTPEDDCHVRQLEEAVSLLRKQVESATQELLKYRAAPLVAPVKDTSPKVESPKITAWRKTSVQPVMLPPQDAGWGYEDDLFGNVSPGSKKSVSSVTRPDGNSSWGQHANASSHPSKTDRSPAEIRPPVEPVVKMDHFDLDDLLN